MTREATAWSESDRGSLIEIEVASLNHTAAAVFGPGEGIDRGLPTIESATPPTEVKETFGDVSQERV